MGSCWKEFVDGDFVRWEIVGENVLENTLGGKLLKNISLYLKLRAYIALDVHGKGRCYRGHSHIVVYFFLFPLSLISRYFVVKKAV